MGGGSGHAVVVEDDENIRELIRVVLEQIGLRVTAVDNALAGIDAVRDEDPALVTLDVRLPGIDGFEAAQRIRAISQTYIVMITARDEEIDTLQGLGAGADDYIVKPFRPRELRARVEAMLRRPRVLSAPDRFVNGDPGPAAPSDPGGPAATEPSDGDAWLEHNGLRINPESRLVELDGEDVALTHSEFDLLHALVSAARRVRRKSDLALLLRGDGYLANDYVSDADRRSVEVHISNLRRKLGDNSGNPRIIETVRGIGYRLTAPLDAQVPHTGANDT